MGADDRPTAAHRLVLVRHAKASSDDPRLADAERPLTDRGRRDAAAVGRWLAARDLRPDLVLCSTSLRTRQTWAAALAAERRTAQSPRAPAAGRQAARRRALRGTAGQAAAQEPGLRDRHHRRA